MVYRIRDKVAEYYMKALEYDPNFEIPNRLLGWYMFRENDFYENLEKATGLGFDLVNHLNVEPYQSVRGHARFKELAQS